MPQRMVSVMKVLAKTALKHLIVFSGLVVGMLMILFIMSQFTTLHEDAYFDGFMSIVYVYAIIIVVLVAYYPVQRYTNFSIMALPKKLIQWNEESGLLLHIAMLFTAITVVNSLMMVVGMDTPKTGTFAYTHLLVRTLIVSIASLAWMYKAVFQGIKHLIKEKNIRALFDRQSVMHTLYARPFSTSMGLFTATVVTGCLCIVIFQRWIEVQGGSRLYLALLLWYGVLLVVSFGMKFYYMRKKKLTTP